MDDSYKNIEEYNLNRKQKTLIVLFDDMIADMLSNKKFNSIVTELFIRGRKLSIYVVFITQSYFPVPKMLDWIQNTFTLWKVQQKKLPQIAFNHPSDIDFQDFMNQYKKYTAKPYSFLVIDTTLAWGSPSRFRTNLVERI